LGRGSEATYVPASEPNWDQYDHERCYDDSWLFDDGPNLEPAPKHEPTVPALSPADVERICALAKWALGTATVALVAVTMWTLCGGGRVRPPHA
jgi:hypothetical protein